MPVVAPKKTNNPLLTIPVNRQFRIRRLKEDMDRAFVEAQTQAKAKYLGLPYMNLYGFPVDTTQINLIPQTKAQETQLGVFAHKEKELFLVTPTPNYPGQKQLIQDLQNRGYTYKLFLCSEFSFKKLLETYDKIVEQNLGSDDINLDIEKIKSQKEVLSNLKEMSNVLRKANTSQIVELILLAAIENNASDIHFEPEKDGYHLRFRLDGILHTFAVLPTEQIKQLESRIKILAGLKLNVENIPQDGRFSFRYDGRDIDVRVSMLPSNYGYSTVLRILGNLAVNLTLEDLGFWGIEKEKIEQAIDKPQGLILTTGPTGSGKTTTLYTFLHYLNNGEEKIITLEDPIEYKLKGISQTQIDAESGYTFASGLRSILRQDPDVVMVGEIRDRETAEIAIQASLTGHKVLSTIHTNDAAGAIPRLMEVGIKGFLLADALSAIVGQRLLRKICPHCKVRYLPTEEEKKIVLDNLSALPPAVKALIPRQLEFYTSTGCAHCNNIGYKGRIGVYEVMTITDGLRELISTQFPSIVLVRQVAAREGMVTMLQDGILKALQGKTDLKEVFKNIQT